MSRASNEQKGPEYEGGSAGMKVLAFHYKMICNRIRVWLLSHAYMIDVL